MKILLITIALLLSASISQAQTVKEQWGGTGISVSVWDDLSSSVTFDCASGSVESGRWPTGQSRVNAVGTYTQHTGARPIPGKSPRVEKAVYKANIDEHAGKMTLSVKVGVKKAVVYRLVLDAVPALRRCM